MLDDSNREIYNKLMDALNEFLDQFEFCAQLFPVKLVTQVQRNCGVIMESLQFIGEPKEDK